MPIDFRFLKLFTPTYHHKKKNSIRNFKKEGNNMPKKSFICNIKFNDEVARNAFADLDEALDAMDKAVKRLCVSAVNAEADAEEAEVFAATQKAVIAAFRKSVQKSLHAYNSLAGLVSVEIG